MTIEGLGLVGLPLPTRDAAAIIANVAIQTETQYMWEVGLDKLTFSNPGWSAFVDETAHSMCTELGAELDTGSLTCELQKLLLYGPGSQ